jgi:catecholate siderophore receptor
MSLRTWAAVAAVVVSVFNPTPIRAQSEPPAAAEPPPAADDGTPLPPVEVITSPEPAPAPAAKKAPAKKAPPAPTTDTAGVPQDDTPTAVKSPIFGAPAAEGDTLNRGTTGVDGYFAAGTSLATKTNTSIMNIPGSVTIITEELAEDQGATSLGEALLYVPGIAVQQGEGHRDQITFRGQETTADFFVDGVRDDIETFRDLYNAESVEVLKGPLAMIFGRGGGGGVINRVTKKADGIPVYEGTIEFGSYGRTRVTTDVGQAVTDDFAVRLNAMYEDSETFRDYSWLERYGINPTVGAKLGDKTTLHLSYEYKVHDQNVDRGGPSINGRPFEYPIETFFGQPLVSFTNFDGHIATATFEHETESGVQFRNHAFFADYEKLYQNIFSDQAVGQTQADMVRLGGYQSLTERQNFINQTDVSYSFGMGSVIGHTVVAGTEVGIQNNNEFRNNPSFEVPNGASNFLVPVSDPTTFVPVFFDKPVRRRFTDLQTTSAFIQDQVKITRFFEVIGGVRYERFDVDFTSRDNPNSPFEASRVDDVWSPRVGAVVKPTNDFHVYASYAKSFLPQNGDNFGQLDVTGSTLEPEQFLNYETGFKWTVAPRLLVTGAVYQLDRENQRVVVANETLANGLTRTKGAEVEISGYVTDEWQVFGGYAYTESEILDAGDNTALVGNSVESVPLHSVSLWNKYQLNRMWGVGLGVIHQSSWFATAANTVKVPGYTRLDGAVFLDLDDNWSAQLNVENIFDNEYWISSHDNNNISYGAPRSAYVTVKATY